MKAMNFKPKEKQLEELKAGFDGTENEDDTLVKDDDTNPKSQISPTNNRPDDLKSSGEKKEEEKPPKSLKNALSLDEIKD